MPENQISIFSDILRIHAKLPDDRYVDEGTEFKSSEDTGFLAIVHKKFGRIECTICISHEITWRQDMKYHRLQCTLLAIPCKILKLKQI